MAGQFGTLLLQFDMSGSIIGKFIVFLLQHTGRLLAGIAYISALQELPADQSFQSGQLPAVNIAATAAGGHIFHARPAVDQPI